MTEDKLKTDTLQN